MEKFTHSLTEFINTLTIGIKLVFVSFFQIFYVPIKQGLGTVWKIVWKALVYVNPHWIISAFYISFAILSAILDPAPPASPANATVSISTLQIMANIFHTSTSVIVVIFGISAWTVSNIRNPIIYLLALLPLLGYAYAVFYGVAHGLLIVRGLLAGVGYLGFGLLAIVTFRHEIQNSINTLEIKKLRLKLESSQYSEKSNPSPTT